MAVGGRPWFYTNATQRFGPVPESLLRTLVRDGQLDPETPVWTEGMSGWEAASVALPRYVGAVYEQPSPAVDSTPLVQASPATLPDGQPVFFQVSPTKFVVMSIVTLGLYELYWAYRTWSFVKQRDRVRMMPFWRAWFMLFWVFDLLRLIKRDLSPQIPVDYRYGWLTFAYVLLWLSARLPFPLGMVSILGFLPLLPAVVAVNKANLGRIPSDRLNAQFTAWNIVGISAFALATLLLVYAFLSAPS